MNKDYEFFWISKNILQISWREDMSESTILKMISIKKQLSNSFGCDLLDIRQGYHSLALHFKTTGYRQSLQNEISLMIENLPNNLGTERKRWYLPVCYSLDDGKDLAYFAKSKGMSIEDIVHAHSAGDYTLYFYGFLPGVMYLGGLAERLHIQRKAIPDPLVKAGSVAIGGKQTGIYPMDSPGGWYVLGKTPFLLFNPKDNILPPFFPGDRIKFFPISPKEFDALSKTSDLKLKYENV